MTWEKHKIIVGEPKDPSLEPQRLKDLFKEQFPNASELNWNGNLFGTEWEFCIDGTISITDALNFLSGYFNKFYDRDLNEISIVSLE